MEGRIKVMVAYDGSAYADAALDDLRRAGLPREAEALIVSVGDGLISTSTPIAEVAGTALTSGRVIPAIVVAKEQATRLLAEAREWAADAIFVGSHGLKHPGESSGLGGVASALVTGAACSVEVVRPDGARKQIGEM